jgi:hypothetical protein
MLYPMVNKRDVEVFIVCLSYHFGMEKLPYHQARGTLVEILYDTIALFLEFSNIWCSVSYNDTNLLCFSSLVKSGIGTPFRGA